GAPVAALGPAGCLNVGDGGIHTAGPKLPATHGGDALTHAVGLKVLVQLQSLRRHADRPGNGRGPLLTEGVSAGGRANGRAQSKRKCLLHWCFPPHTGNEQLSKRRPSAPLLFVPAFGERSRAAPSWNRACEPRRWLETTMNETRRGSIRTLRRWPDRRRILQTHNLHRATGGGGDRPPHVARPGGSRLRSLGLGSRKCRSAQPPLSMTARSGRVNRNFGWRGHVLQAVVELQVVGDKRRTVRAKVPSRKSTRQERLRRAITPCRGT